jgi:hypothetical protein
MNPDQEFCDCGRLKGSCHYTDCEHKPGESRGEVDRLSLIERRWITPGEFGGTKVLYDEADADAWRKAGFDVTGPWVLEAKQSQGAGDALRELYEAGLQLADLIGSDDAYRRWELAMDAARLAVAKAKADPYVQELPLQEEIYGE